MVSGWILGIAKYLRLFIPWNNGVHYDPTMGYIVLTSIITILVFSLLLNNCIRQQQMMKLIRVWMYPFFLCGLYKFPPTQFSQSKVWQPNASKTAKTIRRKKCFTVLIKMENLFSTWKNPMLTNSQCFWHTCQLAKFYQLPHYCQKSQGTTASKTIKPYQAVLYKNKCSNYHFCVYVMIPFFFLAAQLNTVMSSSTQEISANRPCYD